MKAGDRVADIGCGPGYNAVALVRLVGSGGEVVLVDVQQSMLDRALAHCRREPEPRAKLSTILVREGQVPLEGLPRLRGHVLDAS